MSTVRYLPLASDKYDAFMAKSSLLQILDMRGYKIPEKELYILTKERHNKQLTDKEVWEIYEGKESSSLDGKYTLIDTSGRTKSEHVLTVEFIIAKGITKYVNRILASNKEKKKNKPLNILFVTEVPASLKAPISNNNIEVFCYQQLLLNPAKHARAPIMYEKLTPEDIAPTLHAMAGKQFPSISRNDPSVWFLNLKPGDVYRTHDVRSFTGQKLSYVSYRGLPRMRTTKLFLIGTSEGLASESWSRFLQSELPEKLSINSNLFSLEIVDIARDETVPFIFTVDKNLPTFVLVDNSALNTVYASNKKNWMNVYNSVKFYNRVLIDGVIEKDDTNYDIYADTPQNSDLQNILTFVRNAQNES